jgi:hypothetical protein
LNSEIRDITEILQKFGAIPHENLKHDTERNCLTFLPETLFTSVVYATLVCGADNLIRNCVVGEESRQKKIKRRRARKIR